MNRQNATLERPLSTASPRRGRPSGTGIRPLLAAGAGATATLAIVTSGVPMPAAAAVALSLIAMGVVIGSWLLIGRMADRLGPRVLYAVAAAWGAPLLLARPLFSGDVWSYLAQGMTAAVGLDPYRLGPAQALGAGSEFTQHVSHYWADTPAPYGPAWMILSRGVALLTGEHLTAGVLVYRLIALAGIVLIAWSLPRLALRSGAAPGVALWLGLLNPLVLWHLLAGVHNDALMLGLMLAGLELALAGVDRAGRLVAGVVLLTLAANIKFVAGAAFCVVLVAMVRRLDRLVRPVIAPIAGAASGTAVLSLAAGFGWITAPLGSLSVYSWMSPTTATGMLVGAVAGSDVTPAAVRVANVIGMLICVPVVGYLLVAMFRRRLNAIRGLGLIFTVALLCGAVVQPWYVLWAVLPLAAAARTRRNRTMLAGTSAVVAVALPPLTVDAVSMIVGYLIAAVVLGAAALMYRRTVRARAIAAERGLATAGTRHAEATPDGGTGWRIPRQSIAPMREHAARGVAPLPRR